MIQVSDADLHVFIDPWPIRSNQTLELTAGWKTFSFSILRLWCMLFKETCYFISNKLATCRLQKSNHRSHPTFSKIDHSGNVTHFPFAPPSLQIAVSLRPDSRSFDGKISWTTDLESNISHLRKRKIIDSKVPLGGEMLVPWRVLFGMYSHLMFFCFFFKTVPKQAQEMHKERAIIYMLEWLKDLTCSGKKLLVKRISYIYLDLPKGAKWFLKGVNSPSLMV